MAVILDQVHQISCEDGLWIHLDWIPALLLHGYVGCPNVTNTMSSPVN